MTLNKYFFLFTSCIFCLVPQTPLADQAQSAPKPISAFLGTSYQEQTTKFFPTDTIKLYIEFTQPLTVETELLVQWMTPLGIPERYHTQVIKPTSRKDMIYTSWLKIHKKGLFTRMFTGDDYDISYEGEWQVLVFVQTDPAEELTFTMAL